MAEITMEERWKLPIRVRKAIVRLNVSTWEQLAAVPEWEIAKLKNCGKHTVDRIKEELAKRGLKLETPMPILPLPMDEVFSVPYMTRHQIAFAINGYLDGEDVLASDDHRLTREFCQRFVRDHSAAVDNLHDDDPDPAIDDPEVVCENYARELVPLADDEEEAGEEADRPTDVGGNDAHDYAHGT